MQSTGMIKAKGTRVTAKAKNDNEDYQLHWDEDDKSFLFIDLFYDLVDDQFAARHVIDYEKNSPEKSL